MTFPLGTQLSKAAMQPRMERPAPGGQRNKPAGPGGNPRLGQGVLSRVMANRAVQPPKPKLVKPGAPSIAQPPGPQKPKTSTSAMGISKSRVMSDTEIRHRKKVQAISSQVGGTLGLTALGGTLLATKGGQRGIGRLARLAGGQHPKALKPKALRRKVAPVLATSAGIGGASAFNFAAYTKAESKKKKLYKRESESDPLFEYATHRTGLQDSRD